MTNIKKLTDDEMLEVTGGVSQEKFDEITSILTECGNIAWSVRPYGDLWKYINEAEKTNNRGLRKTKIYSALKIIDDYKSPLGRNYSYVLEKLQYCYDGIFK